MDPSIADVRNGATWIADCLLDNPEMARALERLQMNCRTGIRHFSAIGRAVPLHQAGMMEIEISDIENDVDGEIGPRPQNGKS